MDAIDSIIASGAYHDILSIVKGFRNGAVYGMDGCYFADRYSPSLACLVPK